MAAAPSPDWSNKPYWNFGCAYQTAFAAQVADPRDLVTPQAETPADTAMRVRGIESLRKGEDPSTNWKIIQSFDQRCWSELMKGQAGSEHAQIAPVPRISLHAFCESPETAQIIQAAAADRRMERAHVSLQMGGALAALEAYREAATPNVIVLDTAASRSDLLAHLEALAEFCDSGTKVVVAGRIE